MGRKVAFLDTSIFLEYRPFDDIDWPALLEATQVLLAVAPITTNELDAKKDEAIPKLRKRAASVLKKLHTLFNIGNPAPVRDGVEILFQGSEPDLDYSANQLDYRSQDDRLIASVLHFARTNPDDQAVIVTADFGLKVKARQRGISTLSLPDELKLPEEPDPNEKKIEELQRELLELKRSRPELKLVFPDNETVLRTRMFPPLPINPDEAQRQKKLIRLKHKKFAERRSSSAGGLASIFHEPLAHLLMPSEEAIRAFDKEIESFYHEHDLWYYDSLRVQSPQHQRFARKNVGQRTESGVTGL